MCVPKFVHDVEGKACVAYVPSTDVLPQGQSKIFNVTTVLCNKGDVYNKKTACDIARQRLAAGNFIQVRVYAHNRPNEVARQLLIMVR